ncbi:MAG: MarR family winged helix-turn-helix transcriptional regulator [Egibacteraceae bacterium]
MSRSERDRQALVAQLQSEVTQAISDAILFQQAVANRLGLSLSDFKCLTALGESGQATAGEIARRTGLTTGAVTRMIDRLERAGWVRREQDRHDRRRVIVRPVPDRQAEVEPLVHGLLKGWAEALADYPDNQIAMVLELFQRMRKVVREEAALVHPQRSQRPASLPADP